MYYLYPTQMKLYAATFPGWESLYILKGCTPPLPIEILYRLMEDLRPIDTRNLFRKNTKELLRLLKTLSREQWQSPTCYPEWKVKDIAAHLLQTGLNRLSRQRDLFPSSEPLPPLCFDEILQIINNGNDHWQEMFASISPELIVTLLSSTEYELSSFFENLPLSGQSPFSVAWAGETVSENWFDTAREWTERWHHHQQIREAVEAPPLTDHEYLSPVIGTLIRAVPWWYSKITAKVGTQIRITITGEAGGNWTLQRNEKNWILKSGFSQKTEAAGISLSDETAWKFLTRTISREGASDLIEFSGNRKLAEHFLHVRAIMMND